jgi:hypothetical protein
MTSTEAIEQMRQGKKVTHEYFTDHEFIYMENGKIISEDKIVHGAPTSYFLLRPGQAWKENWELFKK